MDASECDACLTHDKGSINSSEYYQPLLTHSRLFFSPFALNNSESQNIQENFKANFPHLRTQELLPYMIFPNSKIMQIFFL